MDKFIIYKNNPRYNSNDVPRPSILFIKENVGNNLVGVEIGTFAGDNALSILKELNIKQLYLVDPYQTYENWESPSSRKFERNGPDIYFNIAKDRLKEFEGKFTFIKKMSNKAIEDIPDNIDFVYIDGNHFLNFVLEDIRLYMKKIRTGGVLSGHDYDQNGVFKAVNRCFKDIYNLKGDWWVVI